MTRECLRLSSDLLPLAVILFQLPMSTIAQSASKPATPTSADRLDLLVADATVIARHLDCKTR
jgi:hypothetical protein